MPHDHEETAPAPGALTRAWATFIRGVGLAIGCPEVVMAITFFLLTYSCDEGHGSATSTSSCARTRR